MALMWKNSVACASGRDQGAPGKSGVARMGKLSAGYMCNNNSKKKKSARISHLLAASYTAAH